MSFNKYAVAARIRDDGENGGLRRGDELITRRRGRGHLCMWLKRSGEYHLLGCFPYSTAYMFASIDSMEVQDKLAELGIDA